ncbi:S9 family peptidase [Pinibacter aurantiacus]|uniref:S9 family peptidase n=1 Tax=Pinibacter aurantiacus TaxID=2851599 RepID=A0A9E2W4J0_9BACT|nr:S9 family peptidase [Pinibacter aurantiacus]MBV4357543.1 S9 family peptidase [Pinibacter aurantiacus]
MSIVSKICCLIFSGLLFAASCIAQPLPDYKPSHAEMVANYKEAARRDSAVLKTIGGFSVVPHWIKGEEAFWYSNVLAGGKTEYIYVNAKTGAKKPLFDTDKMKAAIQEATGISDPRENATIPIIGYRSSSKSIIFVFDGKNYSYDAAKNKLTTIDSLPQVELASVAFKEPPSRWESFETDSLSPNKQYVAFIRDNNVFIKKVGEDTATQYTFDGSNSYLYESLAWSPDSRYVVGYHIKPVKDSSVYYVLSSVPGTTRGQLRSQAYKQPGDPVTTYEMYVFPVDNNKGIKVQTPVIDFFDAPLLHWSTNKQYFFYEKMDRGHQRFRIIRVNAASGETNTVIDEQTKTFIYTNRIFTHYLPATNEIIWSSEKDGWYHLYLADDRSGDSKMITQGNYVVRNIDSIDEKKRQIWFTASGMNSNEDPYFEHYYRIDFDGKNLVALTNERANHKVVFSPDRKYFLDTYSTIDQAPQTILGKTETGKKIADIQKADISSFLQVVKTLPHAFKAKGRDGVTDIWGVYFVPANFDSTKRYPIIENIYAGPQDAFVPKSFIGYSREMQSLADLGFIVVQMDGMGTANRSKSFHDVCWKNLADGGFPDRILWMKALAKEHPYVDTTRVGLYGTSAGGQNALGGLLFHPEFYKAAVAACGCHDNRVDKQWWNEQWMGYPVGKEYEQQSNVTNAYRLQGDLLLIVGEADTNVPPESTYRVIDALIKARKTFDFLPVPGMGHSDGGPYGRMRKRDFFVQHLLGVAPPSRNDSKADL